MYGRGPPPGYGQPPQGFTPPSGPRGGGYGNPNSFPSPPSGPRGGLGSHNAPSHLPRPPNLPQTPSFATPPPGFTPPGAAMAGSPAPQEFVGEKFSLFVGSIVEGVENGWLERILGVAGPVLSFRRPTPAFAFVEYSDAEAVLRCLEVVNGAQIKTKQGGDKTLLVKADEKTRARLDEYEKSRVKNEETSDLVQQAKEDLANILQRISNGDPVSSMTLPDEPLDPARPGPKLPNHLKDLAPEDLPSEQRDNTLSEIEKFRQRAVKKATDKHELNRQIEERRLAMITSRVQQQVQQKAAGASGGAGSSHGGATNDPQSLNRPVDFVGSTANGQAPEGELDDIKRERERAERENRQQEGIFRDRERRFEARERSRIQAWEREMARERNVTEQEERDRAFMAERLATWDDDREAERGRESFYIDRVRWRAQRKPLRAREAEADSRDRALEAQHLAAIQQQSDAFLSQHNDLFATSLPTPSEPAAASVDAPASSSARPTAADLIDEKPSNPDSEPSASTSTPAAAPSPAPPAPAAAVKVSISSAPRPAPSSAAPKTRQSALAMEDDEEEGRRKRAFVPLSYSDDEGEKKPVEKEKGRPSREETHRKATQIEESVPSDKDGLWGWTVRWDSLGQDIVKQKILPFANQLIIKYLGSEEAELLSAVEEYLRDQKSPQELLDELEPVLDEDATDFVVKVWRQLAVETELRHAGVDL